MQEQSITNSQPQTTPLDLDVREQVPLAPYTTLGFGGPARYFAECGSEAQVRAALTWARERGLRVAVLGGGSNVVFADGGFPGLVLRVAIDGVEFRDGLAPGIMAGAGAEWDAVVRGAVERGWAGLECLSGIPGSVGGTPIQNVGAYGQEVAQTLVSVACLDRSTLERRVFERAECDFGYRSSRFKRQDRDRYVVLEVGFRLERDGPPRLEYPELREAVVRTSPFEGLPPVEALRLVRESVLALRRRKSMVLDPADPNTRSAGSFFMNPVVTAAAFAELEARWKLSGRDGRIPAYPAEAGVKLSAAWLVEQAGFAKGHRRGGVGVSSRHALALVNHGGTAAELLALGDAIAGAVSERFGIRLEMEPQIVA
jgi:UDP-N-acetylmuramate dehydrogenase